MIKESVKCINDMLTSEHLKTIQKCTDYQELQKIHLENLSSEDNTIHSMYIESINELLENVLIYYN